MGKLRQTVLILGEGPTEFFYFKSTTFTYPNMSIGKKLSFSFETVLIRFDLIKCVLKKENCFCTLLPK